MKTLLKLIVLILIPGAFWLGWQLKSVQPKEPMSIGESQQILHDLGYYWGPIDYQWGPLTEQAYCDWSAAKSVKGMGQ